MREPDFIIDEIRRRLPELRLREFVPLRDYCSFRIGGPVRALAEPQSEAEAAELFALLHSLGAETIILGRCTNLLVSDKGIDAVALRIGEGLAGIEALADGVISAGAGVTLAKLAQTAQSLGLTGLEFAHGIPGSLGGGVCMNAGAYGGELRDVLTSVRYADASGVIRESPARDLDLSYRHSMFSDADLLVTGAAVKLTPGEPEAISARMRELSERRRASQPLDMPSAGSTFKRPVGGYAAALIDEAGLKGYAIGGAQVSEKHAGFIINRGGAAFKDVLRLIEYVQETVYRRTGIMLEPEVKIIR